MNEIGMCPVCGSHSIKQNYGFSAAAACFNANPYSLLGSECLDCGVCFAKPAANRNLRVLTAFHLLEAVSELAKEVQARTVLESTRHGGES